MHSRLSPLAEVSGVEPTAVWEAWTCSPTFVDRYTSVLQRGSCRLSHMVVGFLVCPHIRSAVTTARSRFPRVSLGCAGQVPRGHLVQAGPQFREAADP